MITLNKIVIVLLILAFPCISYSRYYDPQTSRWISVDPALTTGEYYPTGDKNNDAELPGMGGVFNPVNLNGYNYSGNNPVKFVDPDGRLLAEKNQNGQIVLKVRDWFKSSFTKASIPTLTGYAFTNDGKSRIEVINNQSDDEGYTSNCHGLTFGKGMYWIQPKEVPKILKGDNYKQRDVAKGDFPQIGDVAIYSKRGSNDVNDEYFHSGTVLGVDKKNNKVQVMETLGQTEGYRKVWKDIGDTKGFMVKYYHTDEKFKLEK
ncbi:MAG TPA: hypothetical protein P5123_10070 [Spirochaetota bacterium]|nr:hypothetical protein [Spirochaetota bacterium]